MEQTTNTVMEQTTNTTTKKKKKLTKKSLIKRKYFFKTLMYFGLFLPMFILACAKYNDYFATNKDSFSVASGGILIAIFTLLLVKVGIKKMHKLVTTTFLIAIIWCFNSIIKDFLLIACMFWIGMFIYSILEVPANYYSKLLDTWNDESVRMDVRNSKRSEAKENNSGENDDYGQI